MKTKNIFKTLAAAMLMPAMLLTTACSSEDDFAGNENTENAAKKGYTLPVTVNVTRQGDEAATRAAFNSETKKLEFSTGDKLFVSGSQATAGSFAGTLDYVSDGTFSGTITTENEYSGTIDDLFASAYAYLLPNGYGSYGYLSIDEGNGYDADINDDGSKAFALTKAAAVEQLSKEWAYGYSSGFALEPNNAILNFTISGLAASTEVAVVFSIYDYGEFYGAITGNVTTDASGTATFAIGVEGGMDLHDCPLTVGGNAITLVSSSKQVEPGKIYNITRSVAPAGPTYPIALSAVTNAYIGSVVTTDGNVYATVADAKAASKTAAAMIAYVGSESDCTNGLAIALADESGTKTWSAAGTACSSKTAVTGGTWRLPSAKDWQYMFIGCGSGESYSELYQDMKKSYSELASKLSTAGGDALVLQSSSEYWSSTEVDPGTYACRLKFDGSDAQFWLYGYVDGEYLVRACLAFSVESSAVAPKAAAEATAEDLGKVIGADGNIYDDADAATAAGTTSMAKIMYVGSDAETSTTYNHGLALALSDVSEGQYWCDQSSNICLTTQYSSSTATGDMAGIANTEALVNHGSHTHAAASAARGYNSSIHPTGTSEWFLPSAGQWVKMATAAGGYANLKTNADLQENTYWSSTESTEYGSGNAAWYVSISGNKLDYTTKNYFYWQIRACLAF